MIGIFASHAPTFLYVVGIVMILALLPMAFWPLGWAKVIGWKIPTDNHLAIYYGRCLGCVASLVGAFAILASREHATVVFYTPFLLGAWLLMIAVHAYGAFRKIQPLSETYEIAFWSALAVLTVLFWP